METSIKQETANQPTKLVFMLLIGMCAVILSALAFEHIGGYQPCKLCLQQREPWYIGIPVAALALIASYVRWPRFIAQALLAVVIVILGYSAYLGAHHSGVEWGLWQGPSDCGVVEGGIASDTDTFLQQLEQSVPPSCTDAALRVLGLSFAGWNALASLALALLAIVALRRA